MGLTVPAEASGRLQDIGLVILYPAIFLLVCGTFLGAVWANSAWGSYWHWDPKETWALVTFLVYSFALHGAELKAFRRPRFFHAFCVLAFLCVLITYFGVNLVLGGMHSYA
jgi:ABC-type transport system involved in cytochrome c biogenesis permease subunit